MAFRCKYAQYLFVVVNFCFYLLLQFEICTTAGYIVYNFIILLVINMKLFTLVSFFFCVLRL